MNQLSSNRIVNFISYPGLWYLIILYCLLNRFHFLAKSNFWILSDYIGHISPIFINKHDRQPKANPYTTNSYNSDSPKSYHNKSSIQLDDHKASIQNMAPIKNKSNIYSMRLNQVWVQVQMWVSFCFSGEFGDWLGLFFGTSFRIFCRICMAGLLRVAILSVL